MRHRLPLSEHGYFLSYCYFYILLASDLRICMVKFVLIFLLIGLKSLDLALHYIVFSSFLIWLLQDMF